MFIIDYMRSLTDDGKIAVASYHRGHLGLMPETPVSIALMGYGKHPDHGYEVSVTPFQKKKTLFHLSVVLIDKPGVVRDLLFAVSSLQLNIIVQQSASINHQNFHAIEMLLDWSTSKLVEPIPMPPGSRFRISQLAQLIPTDDFRYVILLSRLFSYCGGDFAWNRLSDSSRGRELPRVRIDRLFERGTVVEEATGTIQKFKQTPTEQTVADGEARTVVDASTDSKPWIGLELPKNVIATVRRQTYHEPHQPLHYIVLSEGEGRNLRIFFPTRQKEKRIIHVSFIHEDSAGALAAIADILSRGERFNIITSLLRRHDRTRQAWELHLEYRPKAGANEDPPSVQGASKKKKLLKWVRTKLEVSGEDREKINRFQIKLAIPKYPSQEFTEEELPLSGRVIKAGEPQRSNDPLEDVSLANKMFMSTREKIGKNQRWAFNYVAPLVFWKPSVFLSFPVHAEQHAQCIREELKDSFCVVDGMEATGREITDDITERICEADYFIGIWQPDKHSQATVSPWLLFEYGIARSQAKGIVLAINISVDESVWKRIDPHISRFRYSDLDFKSRTINEIRECISRDWVYHNLEGPEKLGDPRDFHRNDSIWGCD